MSTRDDLIAARALIDTPEKWGKGMRWDDAHPCALDACRKATGSEFPTVDSPLWLALWNAIPDASPHKANRFIGGYNDDPNTTHADIMALFQRAIDACPVEASS